MSMNSDEPPTDGLRVHRYLDLPCPILFLPNTTEYRLVYTIYHIYVFRRYSLKLKSI